MRFNFVDSVQCATKSFTGTAFLKTIKDCYLGSLKLRSASLVPAKLHEKPCYYLLKVHMRVARTHVWISKSLKTFKNFFFCLKTYILPCHLPETVSQDIDMVFLVHRTRQTSVKSEKSLGLKNFVALAAMLNLITFSNSFPPKIFRHQPIKRVV